MAVHETRVDRAGDEFEFVGFRLSWGAVLAGVVVAVVIQIILSLIGLAIGLGAIDFRTGQPFQGIGLGAGIWAALTALISLFVGGMVAGHMAGVLTRLDGVLHGVLVWGLSVIIALWALSAGVTTLLGGMFGVAGQVLAGAISGVSTVAAPVVAEQGLPLGASDTQGQDRIVTILERQGMSEQQAQRVAGEIQQTTSEVQLQAERIRRQAPATATEVAGTLSTAIWWVLLAVVLSLAAAAIGAAVTAES